MSKIKSNKLSFVMDEGDEEEDAIVVKKSNANNSEALDSNKKFKKMRQAPSLAPLEEKVAPSTIGNSYSSENLKQLRENQKFAESKKFEESLPMEGVEFSGEAAEQLEDKLNSSKPKVRFSFEAEQEPPSSASLEPETPDFIAFKKGQLTSNHLLKGKHNTKISMSFTEKKEAFDMTDDNDEDWESEIARRGSLQNNSKAPPIVMSKGFVIGDEAAKEEITVNTNKNRYSFGAGGSSSSAQENSKYLSVEDASKMIQLAVGKLTLQQEATERQMVMLGTELAETEKEYTSHKEALEAELKKQNVIQDTQEFFRNLIGMLREKQALIEDWKNNTYDAIREQFEMLKRHRIEEQEDVLFRVKEAGELMTIGEYSPSAILDGSDSNTQAIAIATLKTREAAARLSRLKAVDALITEGVSVSAEDRQYFVANRIDKIHSTSIQERLYTLEVSSSTVPVDSSSNSNSKLERLRSGKDSLMSDVEPSVYDMHEAVKQLSAFRDTFPEKYKSAYISPSLPEVLEPLLWIDVISCTDTLLSVFNGIQNSNSNSNSIDGENNEGFEVSERPWHEPLREFSALSVGDEEAAKQRVTITNLVNEGDTNLLPKLVAAVLLPWLSDVIRLSLDPLNTTACTICSDLIAQILDYDVSDAQLAPLLESLVGVFMTGIHSICIPVVKHPQVSTDSDAVDGGASNSGVGRSFLLRQLHRLLSVLKNLLVFKDYLTPLVLMRIGWTTLSVKILAPVCKLLSATDFKNSSVVRQTCVVCCSLIEGDTAMDLNHTLQCGVKIPLFRELKAALHRIEVDKSDDQGVRQALLNILNKF